jgi:hypothetical protein
MMRAKLVITMLTLHVVVPTIVAGNPVLRQSYYDEYERVPWSVERIHLTEFEGLLMREPGLIGYVAYYGRTPAELAVMRRRVKRAVRFLVDRNRVPARRLVIIEGGIRSYPGTVLQPVRRGSPAPKFSIGKANLVQSVLTPWPKAENAASSLARTRATVVEQHRPIDSFTRVSRVALATSLILGLPSSMAKRTTWAVAYILMVIVFSTVQFLPALVILALPWSSVIALFSWALMHADGGATITIVLLDVGALVNVSAYLLLSRANDNINQKRPS